MSKKTVSHLSDIAEQETNAPGITTPILVVNPDQGTMLSFANDVPQGDSTGLPVYMDLRDSAGDDLPTDTKFVLRAMRPTDDEPVTVSVAETNIAAWNNLDAAEQRESDHVDSVKIELKGDNINIRDKDYLRVEIESTEEIDWGHSELYFERDGVQKRPFEG